MKSQDFIISNKPSICLTIAALLIFSALNLRAETLTAERLRTLKEAALSGEREERAARQAIIGILRDERKTDLFFDEWHEDIKLTAAAMELLNSGAKMSKPMGDEIWLLAITALGKLIENKRIYYLANYIGDLEPLYGSSALAGLALQILAEADLAVTSPNHEPARATIVSLMEDNHIVDLATKSIYVASRESALGTLSYLLRDIHHPANQMAWQQVGIMIGTGDMAKLIRKFSSERIQTSVVSILTFADDPSASFLTDRAIRTNTGELARILVRKSIKNGTILRMALDTDRPHGAYAARALLEQIAADGDHPSRRRARTLLASLPIPELTAKGPQCPTVFSPGPLFKGVKIGTWRSLFR